MPPILSLILGLYERLKGSGADDRAVGEALRRLIHGPLVALAVRATPNVADDAILAALQALFPLPTPAAAGAGPGAAGTLAALLGR
jgi:hypothetical protein